MSMFAGPNTNNGLSSKQNLTVSSGMQHARHPESCSIIYLLFFRIFRDRMFLP